MSIKIENLHIVNESWDALHPHEKVGHINELGQIAVGVLRKHQVEPDLRVLVNEPVLLDKTRNRYGYTFTQKGEFWKVHEHEDQESPLEGSRQFYLLDENGQVGFVRSKHAIRPHFSGVNDLLFDLHHPFEGFEPIHPELPGEAIHGVYGQLFSVARIGLQKAA